MIEIKNDRNRDYDSFAPLLFWSVFERKCIGSENHMF